MCIRDRCRAVPHRQAGHRDGSLLYWDWGIGRNQLQCKSVSDHRGRAPGAWVFQWLIPYLGKSGNHLWNIYLWIVHNGNGYKIFPVWNIYFYCNRARGDCIKDEDGKTGNRSRKKQNERRNDFWQVMWNWAMESKCLWRALAYFRWQILMSVSRRY